MTGPNFAPGRASAEPEARPVRIPELDGLRGLAIAGVLVMHLYIFARVPADSVVHAILHRAFSLAYTGVDLFFVLSGFLIGGILLQSRRAPQFYRPFFIRRFFRIVPLYVLLLASWFVFYSDDLDRLNQGLLFAPGKVPLWSYAIFAQNLTMAAAASFGCGWLVVTWSLAIEEQFYLAMPWVVRRLEPARLLALAVFLILLAPVLRLGLLEFSPRTSLAAILLPICRMDALLFGVVAALLLRDSPARAWLHAHRPVLVAAAAGLGAIFAQLSFGNYGFVSWVITPFGHTAIGAFYFVLLLLALHPADGGWRRVLRWRWLRGLGVVSYFVYLFHQPVNFFLHGHLGHQAPKLASAADYGITLLALAVTLGLAALSTQFVERPLQAIGRRITFPS